MNLRTLYLFDADGTLRRCHDANLPCPNKPEDAYIPDPVRAWFHARAPWHTQDSDLIGIVSNQGGVDLGYLSADDAFRMLVRLYRDLTFQDPPSGAVQMCTSMDKSHPDRKPNPGMLRRVMDYYASCGWVWGDVVMVGDMDSDRQAAAALGIEYFDAADFFGMEAREEMTYVNQ